MPVDRRAVLQLGLLLLAVPAQYLILKFMETSESQRSFALRNFLSSAAGLKNKYFTWKSWHKWCISLLDHIRVENYEYGGQDDPTGESPAIEVIKFRDPQGYFGGSVEPRSPRPPNIKFRVGQVIRHKIWGYRGVIIGWDPTARAPPNWLKQMHPEDKKISFFMPVHHNDILHLAAQSMLKRGHVSPSVIINVPLAQIRFFEGHWKSLPNYAILVDTRDRMVPQMTYVPEENIEVILNTKIIHPSIDEYFEMWDGAQYLTRPWLQAVYPHD